MPRVIEPEILNVSINLPNQKEKTHRESYYTRRALKRKNRPSKIKRTEQRAGQRQGLLKAIELHAQIREHMKKVHEMTKQKQSELEIEAERLKVNEEIKSFNKMYAELNGKKWLEGSFMRGYTLKNEPAK